MMPALHLLASWLAPAVQLLLSPWAHAPAWLWLVVLAVTALCALGAWCAPEGRRVRAGRRALAAWGVSLLLVWLAARPRLPSQIPLPTRHAALVLLDDSCSMRWPSAGSAIPTRFDELRRHVRAGGAALASLSASVDVVTARLSDVDLAGSDVGTPPADRESVDAAAADALPFALARCAQRTALVAGLRALAAGTAAPIARALIVSDGSDETAASAAAASQLAVVLGPDLTFPIDTLAVGDVLADLAIEEVRAPPFAFVKTQVPIDVDVSNTNLARRAHAVSVWDGAALLAQESVTLAPGERKTVSFRLRFERVASKALLATIGTHPDERVCENNERAFSLRVLRDKLRVLHVLGAPSFDGRFVRESVLAAHNVDVVSFYILRSPDSDASVPQTELSLIPFPVVQLFTEELKNFDVVILQQFDPRPFGMQAYATNLAQAVRDGLGLVFVGTPDALRAQGWLDTALREVLPVEVEGEHGPEAVSGAPRAVFVAPKPQADPLIVALRALGEGARRGEGACGLHVSAASAGARARPGATVLLESEGPQPGPRKASPRAPLLAVHTAGRGRAAALLTDDAWGWAFAPPRGGGPEGPALLSQLWGQLLSAVSDGANDGPFVRPFASEITANSRLDGVVGRGSGGPVGSDHLELQATFVPSPLSALRDSPRPPAPWLGAAGGPALAGRVALPLASHGEAAFWLAAPRAGRVALIARLASDPSPPATAMLCVAPSQEMAAVQPAPTFLAALSRSSGGRAVDSVAAFAALAQAPPRAGPAAGDTLTVWRPLWPRRWAVGAAFVVLLLHLVGARRNDFRA